MLSDGELVVYGVLVTELTGARRRIALTGCAPSDTEAVAHKHRDCLLCTTHGSLGSQVIGQRRLSSQEKDAERERERKQKQHKAKADRMLMYRNWHVLLTGVVFPGP